MKISIWFKCINKKPGTNQIVGLGQLEFICCLDFSLINYVLRWCHGSPAHRYGLYALQWIVEVNGKKTPDLNAFADATKVLTELTSIYFFPE